MSNGMRIAASSAVVVIACLWLNVSADAFFRGRTGASGSMAIRNFTLPLNGTSCANGTLNWSVRADRYILGLFPSQPLRNQAEHFVEEFTNLTGCVRSGGGAAPTTSTTQTRQIPGAFDQDILVPLKESVEVGTEKCNVEAPAEEGAALGGKDSVESKGETMTITMENEHITEKGEETAACKAIGANGTKKEGKWSGKLEVKGVETIGPEGAFHVSSYPAKLTSIGATSQIFQIGKSGEVDCGKVNYYSGESLVQDSALIRLMPQYVECEYKIGGLKGKPTMEPGECEFSYHLAKGATVGEATFECLKSAMKISGPLGCEVKIGESGNQNLKGITAANVASKPKTIEIKNNISGINVESNSSCELAGLEKGKVGKYSGTIKVEAASTETGTQLGLELI